MSRVQRWSLTKWLFPPDARSVLVVSQINFSPTPHNGGPDTIHIFEGNSNFVKLN